MHIANYKFTELENYEKGDYIFQLIKNRKLSEIYHTHDFYEIIYFLQGETTHLINEKEYTCTANQLVLLRPDDRHCFVGQTEDIGLISLSVKIDEFEAIAKIYGADFLEKIKNSENAIFYHNFSLSSFSLLDYENMQIDGNEYDRKFLLSSILHSSIKLEKSTSALPESLLYAINEIKKTENLKIGIEAFIKLSSYSHTHLARLMRKYYDTTPKRYINELRLQKAYDSIVLTQNSIEQIAEELGFKSYSHFNKIFTERYSLTPASLRRKKKIWTV